MRNNLTLFALAALLLPAPWSLGQGSGQNTTATATNTTATAGDKPKAEIQPTRGVPAYRMSGGQATVPLSKTPGQPDTNTIPTLAVGAVAPDFMAKDAAGKEVRLSDLKGKVVVLDFWATWCGPCKASLPHTQEAAKRYKDQGVVVLANCTSDTRAKFEEFVKANQEKYPDIKFVCDPNEKGSPTFADRASSKLYGCKGIPTQFVIGKDGKIAAVLVGYNAKGHELEDALAKLGIKVEVAAVTAQATKE